MCLNTSTASPRLHQEYRPFQQRTKTPRYSISAGTKPECSPEISVKRERWHQPRGPELRPRGPHRANQETDCHIFAEIHLRGDKIPARNVPSTHLPAWSCHQHLRGVFSEGHLRSPGFSTPGNSLCWDKSGVDCLLRNSSRSRCEGLRKYYRGKKPRVHVGQLCPFIPHPAVMLALFRTEGVAPHPGLRGSAPPCERPLLASPASPAFYRPSIL